MKLLQLEEEAETLRNLFVVAHAILLWQLHDVFVLCLAHVDKHIRVRVRLLHGLEKIALTITSAAAVEVEVTAADALTYCVSLRHLCHVFVIEFVPAILNAGPNEREVVARVERATVH